MAIIGWQELTDAAKVGHLEAIQALITTIQDIPLVGPPDLENAEWEIDENEETLQQKLEKAQTSSYSSGQDYVLLLESITERLREAVNGEGLDLELAKTIAADLGAKPPVNKYTVTLTVEVVVEGVEADDEDAAEAQVTDSFTLDDVTAEGEDVSTDWNITGTEVVEE